jgi:tetratricopeptide (TPR) repeat protein
MKDLPETSEVPTSPAEVATIAERLFSKGIECLGSWAGFNGLLEARALYETLSLEDDFIAKVCTEIGKIYKTQGNVEAAFIEFQRALKIRKEHMSLTEDACLARERVDLLNEVGEIYRYKGKLKEAKEKLNLALETLNQIRMAGYPEDINNINTNNNLGMVYYDQSKISSMRETIEIKKEGFKIGDNTETVLYDDPSQQTAIISPSDDVVYNEETLETALFYFQQAEKLAGRIIPNTLISSRIYNNIGVIRYRQGRFDTSFRLFQKSLEIRKSRAKNTRSLAKAYNNIGTLFCQQREVKKGLASFEEALKIEKNIKPNSRIVARLYSNIADIYKKQGDINKAFDLSQKALLIRRDKLPTTHLELIYTLHNLAELSRLLGEYDSGIKYIDEVIEKDINYKYAYNAKGLILKEMGKPEEALKAFDQALVCDAGYADAMVNKIELETEIARKTQDFTSTFKELKRAKTLQQTDYDEKLSGRYKKSEKDDQEDYSILDGKIEIPRQKFESGSLEYHNEVYKRILLLEGEVLLAREEARDTERKTDALEKEILLIKEEARIARKERDFLRTKINLLEERIDLLEGKTLTIEDSLKIVENFQSNKEILWDREAMDKFIEKRRKADIRKSQIQKIEKNPKLRDYYNALFSEMEAMYIAVQARHSGIISREGYTGDSYISSAISLFPVVGELASKIIAGIGHTIGKYKDMQDDNMENEIRKLTSNITEFDQIALRVALQLTSDNKKQIEELNDDKIPLDVQSRLKKRPTQLVERLLTIFIKNNSTPAQFLGRYHAQEIIYYLQQKNVAVWLAKTDTPPKLDSRATVVSREMVKGVKDWQKGNEALPSPIEKAVSKVRSIPGCSLM